jgi:hypothetical protein
VRVGAYRVDSRPRCELIFERKDAKTQRFREADKSLIVPIKLHLPPAPALVERSALVASLRLCVEKSTGTAVADWLRWRLMTAGQKSRLSPHAYR